MPKGSAGKTNDVSFTATLEAVDLKPRQKAGEPLKLCSSHKLRIEGPNAKMEELFAHLAQRKGKRVKVTISDEQTSL